MSLLEAFFLEFGSEGLDDLNDNVDEADKKLNKFEKSAKKAEKAVQDIGKAVERDGTQRIKQLALQLTRAVSPMVVFGKAIKDTFQFAQDALEVAEAAAKAGMTLEQFQRQGGNKYAIYTKEDVRNAKELEMTLRDIRMGTASIGANIARLFLPALISLSKIVKNVVDFFVDHGTFIQALFIGIATAITVAAIPAIISMGKALWAALAPLLLNPLFWGIAATIISIALVIEDLYKWMHGEPSVAELLFGDFETFKNKFITGFNNVVNAIKGAFEKIKNIITTVIDAIPDWFKKLILLGPAGFAAGLTAEAVKSVKSKIDGSHANGLDYVPYDGYLAELHKGERVQTAAEASSWRSGLAAAKKAVNFTASYPLNAIPSGAVSNAYNNSSSNRTVNIGDITIQTQATNAQGIATDIATYIKQAVISLDDGMLA